MAYVDTTNEAITCFPFLLLKRFVSVLRQGVVDRSGRTSGLCHVDFDPFEVCGAYILYMQIADDGIDPQLEKGQLAVP